LSYQNKQERLKRNLLMQGSFDRIRRSNEIFNKN